MVGGACTLDWEASGIPWVEPVLFCAMLKRTNHPRAFVIAETWRRARQHYNMIQLLISAPPRRQHPMHAKTRFAASRWKRDGSRSCEAPTRHGTGAKVRVEDEEIDMAGTARATLSLCGELQQPDNKEQGAQAIQRQGQRPRRLSSPAAHLTPPPLPSHPWTFDPTTGQRP
jgi:hypothetical protein